MNRQAACRRSKELFVIIGTYCFESRRTFVFFCENRLVVSIREETNKSVIMVMCTSIELKGVKQIGDERRFRADSASTVATMAFHRRCSGMMSRSHCTYSCATESITVNFRHTPR